MAKAIVLEYVELQSANVCVTMILHLTHQSILPEKHTELGLLQEFFGGRIIISYLFQLNLNPAKQNWMVPLYFK